MNKLFVRLKIIARIEILLLKAEASRRANRMILLISGIGCVLLALLFLNVAGFFYLTEEVVSASAAAKMALLNFALSVVPFALSAIAKPTREEETILNLRELAMEDLNRDLADYTEDFDALAGKIGQLRQGMMGVTTPMLGALLPYLIRMLKQSDG